MSWLLLAAAIAAAPAGDPLKAALARAQAAHAPVLAEFHAPWCYSCYYMAKHVQTGPEWEKVEREMVVVGFDADSPEGTAAKTKLKVKALPSYVVLDPKGRELGRILAEQTRADFYAKLEDIRHRGAAFEDLAGKVRDGSPASVAAGREVLGAYLARYDAEGGIAWQARLPEAARAALASDREASLLQKRLAFLLASQKNDANACLVSGQAVLEGELGCERPYELDKFMACASGRPAQEQARLLSSQRAAMDQLIAKHVFGKETACADERSAVLSAADLYDRIGDRKAEKSVLDRAVDRTKKRLGKDYRQDRNRADNLRVYLERAGRTQELDAVMLKLIAAYPDDYVYPFRHGRSLLARGKAAEALPFLEQAAGKAYGQNRLKVAEQRAQALIQLKRRDDAKRVVSDALSENGPWFPEDAAKLRALVGGA